MKKIYTPALHRLLADEECAGNIVIFGAAVVGALCFVAALCAIHFMK